MSTLKVDTITKADGTGSLSVPAETGTVLTSVSDLPAANLTGTLPAIDGSSLTGISGGVDYITEYNQTADYLSSNGETDLTANWNLRTNLNTAVSVSSGVFTFPATGYWLVGVGGQGQGTTSTNAQYAGLRTYFTTNNGSNWTNVLQKLAHSQTNLYWTTYGTVVVDVTDTANCKIKIARFSENTTNFYGSTSAMHFGVTFIKLGDT